MDMNAQSGTSAPHYGFSLMEILVVIAVIGVIFAIVLGVLPTIKHSAEKSACAANLRQIGTLAMVYASDNGGRVLTYRVPPASWQDSDSTDDPAVWWPQVMASYAGPKFSHNVYRADGSRDYGTGTLRELACPTGLRMTPTSNFNGTYAMFGSPTITNSNQKRFYVDEIKDPSKKAYIGDSPWIGMRSGWQGMAYRPVTYNDEDIQDSRGIALRHGGKANMLFHDGHVESLSLEELPIPPNASTGSSEYKSMFHWLY